MKIFNIISVLLSLIFLAYGLKPIGKDEGWDLKSFGQLPVQADGRLKPLDTIARNNLTILSGKQNYKQDGTTLSGIQWLALVLLHPEQADALKVFRIDHPDVLGLFGWNQDRKLFSLVELTPHLNLIEAQYQKINPESQLRNTYETALHKLYQSIIRYRSLTFSVFGPQASDDIPNTLAQFQAIVEPGLRAFTAQQNKEKFNRDELTVFLQYSEEYLRMSRLALFALLPIPQETQWQNIGQGLLNGARTDEMHSLIGDWAQVAQSYRQGNVASFNQHVAALNQNYQELLPEKSWKFSLEQNFNTIAPFYLSIILYVVLFLIVCANWLFFPNQHSKAITGILIAALLIHTIGLILRIVISGRPPVTNLYSSAIFVGWGAAGLGLILEILFKNGIGAATSAIVGFLSLLVARYLGLSGDTMQMLQAVLDTNFWLATHVIVITMGYSSAFLAGFLAIVYLIQGVFTKSLTRETSRNLSRMVYAILCFTLLFSFVGTMLGGIWADQSWGRFWGWDPKENGALLIVLWIALVLHARWGGMIKERGIMILAIGGNIITAWSWFGTNMLGIGLHSYGFMDKAFLWLMIFIFSQLAIMLIGSLPTQHWRSQLR